MQKWNYRLPFRLQFIIATLFIVPKFTFQTISERLELIYESFSAKLIYYLKILFKRSSFLYGICAIFQNTKSIIECRRFTLLKSCGLLFQNQLNLNSLADLQYNLTFSSFIIDYYYQLIKILDLFAM